MPPSSKATNSERPKTPEDRSNYVGNKAIPVDSTAKFSKGNEAWLSIPKRGSFAVKIYGVKSEAGEFFYQVEKSPEGDLYKNGDWFPQQDLSFR